jgi:integrase
MAVQNLRVKDIDFQENFLLRKIAFASFGFDKVYIWDSKSLKDRTIPLPQSIKDELQVQIQKVKELHQQDLQNGFGSVYIPHAISRKFKNIEFDTKWQYVFPMNKISTDPRSGTLRRHHILDVTLSRNIKKATSLSHIDKRVTSHIFRHSYATHLLQNGQIFALFKSSLVTNQLKLL